MSGRPYTRNLSGQDFVAPAPPPERTALWLAAGMALGLLALAVSVVLAQRPSAAAQEAPAWDALAPAREIPLVTWRWLVFRGDRRAETHFTIDVAPGDPAHLEARSAWLLQRGVPGYPSDALVVAVPGRADHALITARIAALSAELIHHVPTLSLRRIGGDRLSAPIAFDQAHMQFLIRERMNALRYRVR